MALYIYKGLLEKYSFRYFFIITKCSQRYLSLFCQIFKVVQINKSITLKLFKLAEKRQMQNSDRILHHMVNSCPVVNPFWHMKDKWMIKAKPEMNGKNILHILFWGWYYYRSIWILVKITVSSYNGIIVIEISSRVLSMMSYSELIYGILCISVDEVIILDWNYNSRVWFIGLRENKLQTSPMIWLVHTFLCHLAVYLPLLKHYSMLILFFSFSWSREVQDNYNSLLQRCNGFYFDVWYY